MKAVIATENGPRLDEFFNPGVIAGWVVVKIKAAALNRADLAMRSGASHGGAGGGLGMPLGLEWAGEVIEVGDGVDQWKVGDRVMGASPGAFAEYLCAFGEWIYPIPDTLSYEQAAGAPVALQTVHDALVTNGQLESGQTVLVQGGSSAVGLMAVQVAKYLGASQVIATSTTAQRRDCLKEIGADVVIDSKDPAWVDQVLEVTDQQGVDLTIDLLAGPLMTPNMNATRIGGRIINIGRMAGEQGELDFDLHSMRRITYTGVTFRTRTPDEISTVIGKAREALIKPLADGDLVMPVDSVYPMAEFDKAFDVMAANRHYGKLILSIDAG